MKIHAITAALLAFGALSAQAATYGNANDDDDIGLFGAAPATTTYGQTFTLGAASVLNSWTFYGGFHTGGDNLRFVVASWDAANTRATTELYSTPATWVSTLSASGVALNFNGLNLNLAAGDYVAYVTVSGVASGAVEQGSLLGSAGNGGLGGAFFYDHAFGADPLSHTGAWSPHNHHDSGARANMLFSANIDLVSSVPEASTTALWLLGLAGVAAFSHRRRAQA